MKVRDRTARRLLSDWAERALPEVLVFVTVGIAACSADSPVAPIHAEPSFLVGQSPLLPVFVPWMDPATDVLTGGSIEFPVDVNKGIINTAAEDRFVVRSGIEFTRSVDGSTIADLATKDEPVSSTDPKDDGLRKGSTVPFDIDVPLGDEAFLALLLEPADAGVNAEVALVLKSGSGSEKILDQASGSAGVAPRDYGPLVEAAPASVLTTEDPNGALSRSAIVSVYMPAVLAEAIANGQAGFNGFVEFSLNGDPVALGDPHPSPVVGSTPANDDVALVVIAVPIDAPTWAAAESAAPNKGDVLDIVPCILLVLPDTGAGEATLMMFESTGKTEPAVDGLPAKQEDDGSGK